MVSIRHQKGRHGDGSATRRRHDWPAAHGKDFANRRQMQMQKPRKQNKEPMMSGKEMKRTRRKQRRLATMKAAIKAMEDQQRG